MTAQHADQQANRSTSRGGSFKSIADLVGSVAQLTLWRQRGLVFAAGIASVLAMPPFHCWPVLWVTLPLLCVTADIAAASMVAATCWTPWRRSALGRAAEMGWWFGFGYHVAGLFWIGEAFLVEAEVFAWLLPFAVTLLPAGLALFTAAATASMYLVRGLNAFERVVALAAGFGVTEWLRGHIMTGFPWNVLGTALTWPLTLMQSVSLLGIYGLTLIAVLVFAGPVALLRSVPERRARAIAMAVLPLLSLCLYGAAHLAASAPSASGKAARPKIRIVQASVPQRERLQPANTRRIFDQHLSMSLTAPDGTVDNASGIAAIVWPEAAMPFVPLAQPVALDAIGAMLPAGTQLISGALRLETDATTGTRRVYNSLLAFDDGGADAAAGGPARLLAQYDKLHLVPFGEYLPVQWLLERMGLQELTRQRGGFAAGIGPRLPLQLAGLGQVLPMICYEVIFPQRVGLGTGRPDLILTITNDGWFGTTTGPRQHYHQARVRAVELGIPMVRASSNGISALFDGNGRELGRLGLNAVGTLDVSPPGPLDATPYAKIGDSVFWLLISAALLRMIVAYKRLSVVQSGIEKPPRFTV